MDRKHSPSWHRLLRCNLWLDWFSAALLLASCAPEPTKTPVDAAPDVGALESGQTAWTAGSTTVEPTALCPG
jgi:hypothetical protein